MLVPYSDSSDAGSPLEADSSVSSASRPKVNRALLPELHAVSPLCVHCGLSESYYAMNPACDFCFCELFACRLESIMYVPKSTKLV